MLIIIYSQFRATSYSAPLKSIWELTPPLGPDAQVLRHAHPQLAQQLQVRSLPTVFGLANGELVDQFVGLVPQPQLDEFLAKLRASGGTVRDT